MHKNQAILNSIYQSLLTLVSNNIIKEVLKNTIQEPRNYPCVVMKMGGEEVVNRQAFNTHDLNLQISFDVVVKNTNKDVDVDILVVCSALQAKLLEDYKQGLDFVINTTYEGRDRGEYQGEAEHYYALSSLNYNVRYRTDVNNPNI